MATLIRRYAWVAVLVSLVVVEARPAFAQFLCTAGSRDGQECLGDDDCPGGVCVIPLGVCASSGSEVEYCICPGSECVAEPVCSDNGSFGTCVGGVFQDYCCDLADNCSDQSACVSTQKVWLAGSLQGFPCMVNANCDGSVCTSTGKYCFEGANDSFTCVDDDDCPDGTCVGGVEEPTPAAPTSTVPPTATNVPTNTRTASPVVSVTPQPTGQATATTIPVTNTPGNTVVVPTNTPRATDTPAVGFFVSTTANAFVGGNYLSVGIAPANLALFPVQGVVEFLGQRVGFTRRRTSTILNLTAEQGLAVNVPAGTSLLVVNATPGPLRPGGLTIRNEQGGTGCAMQFDASGSVLPLLIGLGMLFGGSRFGRRARLRFRA